MDSGKSFTITLCGSTRFMTTYEAVNLRLTVMGITVLTVGCNFRSVTDAERVKQLFPNISLETLKERADWLHLHKIQNSDAVLILNVDGYVGKSTKREIDYAVFLGVPVFYLEKPHGNGELVPGLWGEYFWRAIEAFVPYPDRVARDLETVNNILNTGTHDGR